MIEDSIKEGVAIDIGANISYFTLLLAQRCKTVYAFEPSAYTYEILCKNILINKLAGVIAMRNALSNEKGSARFYHAPENSGGNSLIKKDNFKESDYENVECARLDDLIPDKEISFMKLDVEGHEAKVLEGGKHTLANTKTLMMEYDKHILNEKSGNHLLKMLKGFKIGRITKDGVVRVKSHSDLSEASARYYHLNKEKIKKKLDKWLDAHPASFSTYTYITRS